MISENELNEYRETIQKIIDKHLPAEKRFSVKDFSQEELWYLSRLFLAKTQEDRDKVRKEMDDRQKAAHQNFLEQVEEINYHKNKYDIIFNSIDEINSLNLDIDLDSELDSTLDSALQK